MVGQELEVVGLADGDELSGRPHDGLGGGQGPAIFGDGAPRDRLSTVTENRHDRVGIVAADINEAQAIFRTQLQRYGLRLRRSVQEQSCFPLIGTPAADDKNLVYVWIELLPRFHDDDWTVQSAGELGNVVPMSVVDKCAGARRSHSRNESAAG